MIQDNIKFFIPIEIEKAKNEKGEEIMRLAGIASARGEDADGEDLDPNGFDLTYLKNQGVINWNHSKNPLLSAVGEPYEAKITKDGLHLTTHLYKDHPQAQEIWQLAKILKANSKTRRIGYSIEGKALERDPLNPKKVTKAAITGCALTLSPKNPKTFADIIKGNVEEDYEPIYDETEEEKDETKKALEAGSQTGMDVKDSKNASGAALKKESVDKKIKNIQFMSKAQVYEQIFFRFGDMSNSTAENIFNLINKISKTMAKDKTDLLKGQMDEETLNKAVIALTGAIDTLVKGGADDDDESDEDEDEDDMDKSKDEPEMKKYKKKMDASVDKAKDEMKKGLSKSAIMKGLLDGGLSKEDTSKVYDLAKAAHTAELEKSKDSETEVEDKEKISKAISSEISKGFEGLQSFTTEKFGHVGVIMKGIYDEISLVKGEVNSLRKENEELRDQNEDLKKSIDDLSAELDNPVTKKSVTKATPTAREKQFSKGLEDDLNKGNDAQKISGISINNRKAVLEVLDSAAFSKGFDAEFAKALTSFEASGRIAPEITSRLRSERGINILAN